MSEQMLWIERFFNIIYKNNDAKKQILFRFGFLLVFWLFGAIVYAQDNLLISYVTAIGIYEGLYFPSLIIFLGSYGVQKSIDKIIPEFRTLLNKNEQEFNAFQIKILKTLYSVTPCFVIALMFAIFLSGVPTTLLNIINEGLKLRFLWDLFTALFFDLVAGTGVWMFLGIWLIILTISRQEFSPNLLDQVFDRFKELMKLVLNYALFYFITISIAVALPLLNNKSGSWVEVIFSPYLIFVLLGAVSVLFPLFSIHATLVKLKTLKITQLKEESQILMLKLDETKENEDVNKILTIIAGFQAIQLKEKYIQSSPDWPVNLEFIGKLAGLVILPTIVRIFVELFKSYLPF